MPMVTLVKTLDVSRLVKTARKQKMKFNMDYLKGLLDQVKVKGSEYTGVAADKAKDAARIAKLSMDLNTEKDNLKKAYLELGKACCAWYADLIRDWMEDRLVYPTA